MWWGRLVKESGIPRLPRGAIALGTGWLAGTALLATLVLVRSARLIDLLAAALLAPLAPEAGTLAVAVVILPVVTSGSCSGPR